MKENISILIEALLYWRGEPMKISELAKILAVSKEDIETAAGELETALTNRGVTLMRHDGTLSLVTTPDASELIEKLRKEELSRDLGKAALETLSIVLYKGPLTRADIEYIRGVNCTSILRTLLIRGLVEKIQNPNDQRSSLYRATSELLMHLGVASLSELPNYESTKTELDAFIARLDADETIATETPTEHA